MEGISFVSNIIGEINGQQTPVVEKVKQHAMPCVVVEKILHCIGAGIE
jgi:hypothetical protein